MADFSQGQISMNKSVRTIVSGPWFEDFYLGQEFNDVPSVTITSAHAAFHQALFGDRMRLYLDQTLSEKITGKPGILINPSLVANLAIGQSTVPSQRVMGNLFYKGLVFREPVFVGDTIKTKTKVVGLKQNKVREGRAASGMVALEIHVLNQKEETVLLFWRCPMIPCRDALALTHKDDDFSFIPDSLGDLDDLIPQWDLQAYRNLFRGGHGETIEPGCEYLVESRDTITLAPELVRMTLNMAMTHTDADSSVYGKRLVYGGHTISMAAAQMTRALPNMVTILGWYSCDHLAPVFEEDTLQSTVNIDGKNETDNGCLVDISVRVVARRGRQSPDSGSEVDVLLWKLCGLFA